MHFILQALSIMLAYHKPKVDVITHLCKQLQNNNQKKKI